MTRFLDIVSVEPMDAAKELGLGFIPWLFAGIVAVVAVMMIIDVIKKHRR